MFEHLKRHKVILVCGPMRSGTCFTAKAIAYDTDKEFVPEKSHGYNEYSQLKSLLPHLCNSVVHAPSQSPHLERISKDFPRMMIVFVLRSPLDVVKSEERIGRRRIKELRYPRHLRKIMPRGMEPCVGDVYNWLLHQRRLFRHKEEVCYDDLQGHPLWVAKPDRESFSMWQTRPGDTSDGEHRGRVR